MIGVIVFLSFTVFPSQWSADLLTLPSPFSKRADGKIFLVMAKLDRDQDRVVLIRRGD